MEAYHRLDTGGKRGQKVTKGLDLGRFSGLGGEGRGIKEQEGTWGEHGGTKERQRGDRGEEDTQTS